MFLRSLREKIIQADGFGAYLDPLTKHRMINAPPINDFVKDLTPDSVAKERQKRAKSFLEKLGEKIKPKESKESFEVNLELIEPTKNLPAPSGLNTSYPQEALWWQKAIAGVSVFYHGSPEDQDELVVHPFGRRTGHDFGGVFLAKGEKLGHIGLGPQYWYYIELEDDEILIPSDLWYHVDPHKNLKVKKVLDQFLDQDVLNDEEVFDRVWTALCDRYNYIPDDVENIVDGWTCQTIQGQIAKALGYKAVELSDERGRVFLLPGPNKLKRLNADSSVEGQIALAKAFGRGDIAAMADTFLKKYFHELGSFPVPRIEIVNNPKSSWNGRCIYKSSDRNNTTIKLQKLITSDETTLKRVLLHELIHHVDFLTNFVNADLRRPRHDGHGEFFKHWAAKINAVEGAGFVTEKSDENYVESLDQEFFMLIAPMERGFAYAWTLRPSFEQKQVIQVYMKKYNARLIETKDIRWLKGSKISKRIGLSRPLAPEDQQKLKDLYDSGTTEVPNTPAYLMVIEPAKPEGYRYTWVKKADTKSKKWIDEMRQEGAKVVFTQDLKWATKSAQSKEIPVFRTPLDKDRQDELKTLYLSSH